MRRTLRMAVRGAVEAVAPPSLLVSRGSAARRAVALTFDDGPHELTPAYLDVLDRFGARATFFVVGDACIARRAELLEILRRGHELAGHGFTHRTFPSLRGSEIRDELERTAALLPPSRNGRPLVRPPRGAVSARSLLLCAAAGYTTALWSLDSDDCRTDDARVVVERVAPERVRAGEIVLLHEGQRWTLDALPNLLGNLRRAGYHLATVGELLGRD
jgi:peptidoglycan/xylan/chitin deacetylase (PgdA/CDA1 family)